MAYFDVASLLAIPAWLLAIVLIWSLVWKGIALWISARKTNKIWFVILLVVNTIGILEILYIFLFSKLNLVSRRTTRTSSPRTTKKRRR